MSAENGFRKGPVAGIGIGYAPLVYWQRDKNDVDNLQQARSYHIFIGYGLNAKNVFALEINAVFYDLDFLPGYHVSQGISGLQWYHYMKDSGSSFFTSLGFGHFGRGGPPFRWVPVNLER